MNSERFVITDQMWSQMEPHCLGKKSDPGRTGGDARLFLEAVLWIARTDSPWRDLPPCFGKWNTVFKRFRDWVKADVFKRIFDALSGEPDMEYVMIDGTIVKVHRHAFLRLRALTCRPAGQGAKALTAIEVNRLTGSRGLKARLSGNPEAG